MRVLVFGGTGMLGQGIVRECVRAPHVTEVLAVGRRPVAADSAKLHNVLCRDMFDLSAVADSLAGVDACFDALGVSSLGRAEPEYRRLTKDLTLGIADAVAAANPDRPELTFAYVSGAGTDSSERGRQMWARVKGETENALLGMPFRAAMFRPGIVEPRDGARSQTAWLARTYRLASPAIGVVRRFAPNQVVDTVEIGRAMVNLAAGQVPDALVGERVFDNRAIALLAGLRPVS